MQYSVINQSNSGERFSEPKVLKEYLAVSIKGGGYGVVCIRTGAEGEPDMESIGRALFYTTKNLVLYECKGFVKVDDIHVIKVQCDYDKTEACYRITWMNGLGPWIFLEPCR